MAADAPVCPACEAPVTAVDGCGAVIQLNAHRYGEEAHFADGELKPKPRCADCSARVGHHHHANCLQAHCFLCGDQAVCCEHAGENGAVL